MRLKTSVIVAALLLLPLSAYGASLLQQKDHGGAVWQRSSDGTTVPVGDTGLVVEMTDLVTAATKYVLAYKSGNIMRVYSVLQGAITGNSAVTIRSNNAIAVGESFTNTGHSLTLTASGSAAGTVDSSVLAAPTTATRVNQGDVIAVIGDGGSTIAEGVTFTIVIE